jgi:Tol biopolymer transport system component
MSMPRPDTTSFVKGQSLSTAHVRSFDMRTTRPISTVVGIYALLLALALGAALAMPPSVQASYPGSHNGRLIFAINLNGNYDLYSVLPNGHALHRLTTDPAFDLCPASSADGKQIAFCSNRTGAYEIWTMKANGTQQRQVTHLGGFAIFPDFSPDGSKIVFSGSRPEDADMDIFVVNADGSGLVRLTTAPGDDQYPAWSPDGRSIVFISTRTGIGQVWLMSADGSNQRQLTFDAGEKDQVPDWKPDGTRIAYECVPAICVMNADGSGQRRLTTPNGQEDDFGPAWSPDGRQIAFVHWIDEANHNVYVMNADGSNAYAVHPTGRQAVPAWQPRGGSRFH